MADVFQATRKSPWRNFADANLTTTDATPALVDVAYASLPATAKTLEPGPAPGAYSPSLVEFLPYGVGTATNTFDARIVGFNRTADGESYIPKVLARVTCTLSAITFAAPNTTQKTCDDFTFTEGDLGVDVYPYNNAAGWSTFVVDMKGCEAFDIHVDVDAVTSVNFKYREW